MEMKQIKQKSTDSEVSLYSYYHLGGLEDKSQDSGVELFDERTLQRHLRELCEKEILRKEGEYYMIHPNYMNPISSFQSEKWKQLMEALLDSGAYKTYVTIREYLSGSDGLDQVFMGDQELKRYIETVREPVDTLQGDNQLVRHINEAIDHKSMIQVEYKGKEMMILPICYLITRDDHRTYLYYMHRNKLETMQLQAVKYIREGSGSMNDDREAQMERIQRAWNIGVEEKQDVQILVPHEKITEKEDYSYVTQTLEQYLGFPERDAQGNLIFSGTVLGINDFKVWIRRYIDFCIVNKPESLRQEIKNSLQKKIERYEGEE